MRRLTESDENPLQTNKSQAYPVNKRSSVQIMKSRLSPLVLVRSEKEEGRTN